MQIITTREQFITFARTIGVRPDWHEPDEQGITARVEGTAGSFDNAGMWPASEVLPWPVELANKGWEKNVELHVIISRTSEDYDETEITEDLACVNLATLCSWAAEPREVPEVAEVAEPGLPQGVYRRGADL